MVWEKVFVARRRRVMATAARVSPEWLPSGDRHWRDEELWDAK